MSKLKIVQAILFLLIVLASNMPAAVSAVSVPSGILPGVSTLPTLTLEDDYAVLASGPGSETALTSEEAEAASSESELYVPNSETIAIRALNPGYTLEAGKNSGELIELVNLSDGEVALDYLALIYTAKPTSDFLPGKSTVLYRFPADARFVGQSILLRYRSAPEVAVGAQDLTYDTSLAMNGSLALVQTSADFDPSSISTNSPLSDFGEVINSLCWLGGEDCLPVFSTTVKSRSYTTILRDDETGEYAHVTDATLLYNPEHSGLYLPPESSSSSEESSSDASSSSGSSSSSASTDTSLTSSDPQCLGLEFSEILTYYDEDATEQFIEFYNSSDQSLQLLGCKVRYKNKLYDLVSEKTTLPASGFLVLRPTFRLTKNPTSENLLELIDVTGDVISSLSYPHGQKKSTSYALIGYNSDGSPNWQITYAVTPGSANVYQQYRTCEAGKVINEATGNCVNASTMSNTLKDCGEGKYRNPETGRCKSLSSSSSEQTPCKEGYERNPETNRCRKIKENNGTDYPVVPLTDIEEKSTFIALWAIGAIAVLGGGYVVFQFRREILYFFRKVFGRLKR